MVGERVIDVEVAYATPKEQCVLKVAGHPGMTVLQAIQRSKILERFPEIDLESAKVGIFGKPTAKDNEIRDGDRVEIYRPLIADPKQARKKRAAQGKAMKKGGGGREVPATSERSS
jgi:putative ubiquitin-RnfH superfamily antitoxin RatB of RatAB toxin-antitoxin module